MPIVRNQKIEPLFSENDIARRNRELAEEIVAADLRNILVVSVLKGSFVFAADLLRAMHGAGLSPEVEFISISSYGSGTRSGEIRLLRDIDSNVKDRDILLIDDILESGNTMNFTRKLMLSRGARRVSSAVLLDKSMWHEEQIHADHVGFECPDKFVVGYGMDVGHAFRELPFIGFLAAAT